MTTRAHDVLEGMGELLLSLARKHCDPHQWASWLKVQNGLGHVRALHVRLAVDSLLQRDVEPANPRP